MKYWIGISLLINAILGYFLIVREPIYINTATHSKETIYKYKEVEVPVYIHDVCEPTTIIKEIIKECDINQITEVEQTRVRTTEGRIYTIKEKNEHRFILYGATGHGVIDKTLSEDGDGGYINSAKYGTINEAHIMYSPKGTNLWFGAGYSTNKNKTIGLGYEWGF